MQSPESQEAIWSHEVGEQQFDWSPQLADELEDILYNKNMPNIKNRVEKDRGSPFYLIGSQSAWRGIVGLSPTTAHTIKQIDNKTRERKKRLLKLLKTTTRQKEEKLRTMGPKEWFTFDEQGLPTGLAIWNQLTKNYRMVLVHAFHIKMNELKKMTFSKVKDEATKATAERIRLQKIFVDTMIAPERRNESYYIPNEEDNQVVPEDYEPGTAVYESAVRGSESEQRKSRRFRKGRKARKTRRSNA